MQYGIISHGPIKLGFVGVLLFVNFDDDNATASSSNTVGSIRTASTNANINTTSVNFNTCDGDIGAKTINTIYTGDNTYASEINEFSSNNVNSNSDKTNGESIPAALNEVTRDN